MMKMINKIIPIIFLFIFFLLGCIRGQQGPTGSTGSKGTSCTVEQESNGINVNCSDGTTAFVANGQQGVQGNIGPQGPPSPNTITIQPWCNLDNAPYPEEYIQINNHQDYAILTSFGTWNGLLPPIQSPSTSNPYVDTAYLILVPNGEWETSDGYCTFSIDVNGMVSNCQCKK